MCIGDPNENNFADSSPRAISLGFLVPILRSSRRVSSAARYRWMIFASFTRLSGVLMLLKLLSFLASGVTFFTAIFRRETERNTAILLPPAACPRGPLTNQGGVLTSGFAARRRCFPTSLAKPMTAKTSMYWPLVRLVET